MMLYMHCNLWDWLQGFGSIQSLLENECLSRRFFPLNYNRSAPCMLAIGVNVVFNQDNAVGTLRKRSAAARSASLKRCGRHSLANQTKQAEEAEPKRENENEFACRTARPLRATGSLNSFLLFPRMQSQRLFELLSAHLEAPRRIREGFIQRLKSERETENERKSHST